MTYRKLVKMVAPDLSDEALRARDLRGYNPLKNDAAPVQALELGLTRRDHDRELDRRIRVAMTRDPGLSYRRARAAEFLHDPWLKRKVAGFE